MRPVVVLARASAIVVAAVGSVTRGMSLGSILPGRPEARHSGGAGITLTGRVLGTLYPGTSRPIELIAENKSAAVRRIATVRLR